jgi:Holliday junction resolvase RusA-like endonuclease
MQISVVFTVAKFSIQLVIVISAIQMQVKKQHMWTSFLVSRRDLDAIQKERR